MRLDPREAFSQAEMDEYEAMLDAQEEYEQQMAAAAEAEDEDMRCMYAHFDAFPSWAE